MWIKTSTGSKESLLDVSSYAICGDNPARMELVAKMGDGRQVVIYSGAAAECEERRTLLDRFLAAKHPPDENW